MHYRVIPKSMTLEAWMTLNGHFTLHSVSNCIRFRRPPRKLQWRQTHTVSSRDIAHCAMTVVSGNMRFMQIFAGVPSRRGVKRQWSNENVDFQGFRTLRLRQRHLRKQESRADTRKPRNVAAVLFGLKFAHNIHYHYKLKSRPSKARLQIELQTL